MSAVHNLTNAEKLDLPFAAWKLSESEDTTLVRLSLTPGERIPSHVNPLAVFFFVISGSGDLIINEKEYQLKAGDSIFVEKDLHRTWVNSSREKLDILVIKQL